MLALLTAAALSLGGAAQSGTDQTVTVSRGARLEVSSFSGDVTVDAWDRDTLRVQSDHSSRDRIAIDSGPVAVTVRPTSRNGAPRSMDLHLTVPRWMRVDVSGTYTDVTITGVQSEVNVETVRGDVTVTGGSKFVSLKSVEGAVVLRSASGRITLRSVNEGIVATDVSGDLSAETVNGDIELSRIQASNVDAATVNGDISYDGAIRDEGQYRITTHNGDIEIGVPEKANARISVRTFNGELEVGFPVKLEEGTSRNRRFDLTLGSGSARIELESFGGTIHVAPPGSLQSKTP
jgi:hypothetical protein